MNIYNAPKKIFIQLWDKPSNNQVNPSVDPLYFINVPNFKIIRFGNIELTVKNLILIIIILLIYFLISKKYF
jgi:hypothetical protein